MSGIPESGSGRSQRIFEWADLLVMAGLGALIYGVVAVAREWTGALKPTVEIQLDAIHLPLYALFSLTRGVAAFALSFVFTMIYACVMARVAGTERFLLPTLDILQSIPVLGFLPGFVLGLAHLFPHANLGLELASVLMIFTGQVWNMTFSFYASLKSVPEDLVAVARIARLTWWQRFLRLDLSFAARGLAWNGMLSMAGGWFFLTVSEAFQLGDHDFRLPGLGAYMSVAIDRGDTGAQFMGVMAMLAMIIFLDQVVWRPVVAWSQKFGDDEAVARSDSWIWEHVGRSRLWRRISQRLMGWLHRMLSQIGRGATRATAVIENARPRSIRLGRIVAVVILGGLSYALVRYVHLLMGLRTADWIQIFEGAGMTFGRVLAAVALASLWTVPAGVWIGRRPLWTQRLQPVIQMAASFPAPMIFPVVVGAVMAVGGGLGWGSVVLLVLSTQWYILFNVIAGTSAIPRDLWEMTRLARLGWSEEWRRLILPAVFPALLTGWITAIGAGWNASIVAEYMKYKGTILTTTGLGALISRATEQGNFPMLGAAVGLMAFTVVGFNRMVWRPLSQMAQTRYQLSA